VPAPEALIEFRPPFAEPALQFLGRKFLQIPDQADALPGQALLGLGADTGDFPHGQGLQEALRLDPDDAADLTFDLGAALDEAGDHATAATHFRKAVELRFGMGVGWLRLGWALVADGRYAEAIPVFDTASRYRPKSARLWHGLGIAYARTGQDLKAVQAYRLCLRADPARLECSSTWTRPTASWAAWTGCRCRAPG
jgi:tetratricopeptide (TPR) repeat protein